MILYIVNVTIKKEIHDEWLHWMKTIHIPNMLKTGYFIKADIYDIILPAKGNDTAAYSVQYVSETYEKFMSYSVKESKKLQKEHTDKFGAMITAERFVMEKCNETIEL